MVAVHPPAGHRCPICGDAAGEGLYCTFECKISSYCGYCCGSHHRAKFLGTAQSGSLEGVVKTLGDKVRHQMYAGAGLCIGVCTTCGDQVEEEDCTGHPCFRNDSGLLLQRTGNTTKAYPRDAFCQDCGRAFSVELCRHHDSHRTLSVISYDHRYFCVALAAGSTQSDDAFAAIKEMPASAHRLIPIRLLGAARRCHGCCLVLTDAGPSTSTCSIKCAL